VYDVTESGLLIDSNAYYRAFFRAAAMARNYILLAGWRFESNVRLVRGTEAEQVGCPTGLLAYLDYLCGKNPRLVIYVLAWDFSLIFALDREWFLKWKFNRTSNGRIHFRFDKVHAIGATHHQKFAVIDGRVGFVGGIDFSAGHWDDSDHRPDNPDRVDSKGNPYEPCHDLQTFFSGPAVQELVDLFFHHWSIAGRQMLELLRPPDDIHYDIEPSHSLPASRIALSRTAARTILPIRDSVVEIRSLFLDAIAASTRLIYIENQYFSSQAVYKALVDRMKAKEGTKLEIVIVLPGKMHAFFEELSLGLTQMRMTRSLRKVADDTGHSLGIYWTAANGTEGGEIQTYIHAKLILIDDRFLSVGSANTTNRSMGLDSELNVSWEADPERDKKLVRSIRRVRVKLIAEHAGLRRAVESRRLYTCKGLVAYLDRLTDTPRHRLRRYNPEFALGESNWLHELGASDLIIDPEKPIIEENVYEHIARNKTSFITRGILLLNERLRRKRGSR
jgi:phosphatidylserine/phosphatidylglycerophosphate/cardiolipin synthase-like enzyme